MKSTKVEILLSRDAEFELRERFGWKCSRPGLIARAVGLAIKSNGAAPKPKEQKKPRAKKADKPSPVEGEIAIVCSKPCGWSGKGTLKDRCPECSSYVLEAEKAAKNTL